MSKSVLDFVSVRLDDENDTLIILDQTKLPNEIIYHEYKTKEEVWDSIYKLEVRGAPAIGIAGAYGVYLATKHSKAGSVDEFYTEFMEVKKYLASSRPTAVNLFWALDRMEKSVLDNKDLSVSEIISKLHLESESIRDYEEEVSIKIGKYGLSLLKKEMGLLTHCNTGTIATAKYGTALAPIYLGHEDDYNFKVYANETRPLLQGARLTTWELDKAGVDVTLLADNMTSIVMNNGWIDAVVVGADRIAENGDTANKIGTSGISIIAKEYGVPFYVFAPLSTIDLETKTGKDIEIELRNGEELYKTWYEKPMAPEGIKTYNPAFDVTDAKFITAIITEKGIAYPPFNKSLRELFEKK